jgi:hypothetical protein
LAYFIFIKMFKLILPGPINLIVYVNEMKLNVNSPFRTDLRLVNDGYVRR